MKDLRHSRSQHEKIASWDEGSTFPCMEKERGSCIKPLFGGVS